jgi:dTDP-L-rhamnose 4-epimerase
LKAKRIQKILVTGGAGFIGSHTVGRLVQQGYEVRVLDSMETQVHGEEGFSAKDVQFVRGSIRERNLLSRLVEDVDAVVHLASLVGVGQSMYQIERYTDGNTGATSTLLDVLANEENSVRRLIVASSMSIYGEGQYYCDNCKNTIYPGLRNPGDLKHGRWEHVCKTCNSVLRPTPVQEEKPLVPTSVYAMTKRHQEEMCLLIGKTYGISTLALRYFNVYGPGQSLRNPYTGAAAIFACRALNGNPALVFEDGNQTRDFVHVEDVAKANAMALEAPDAENTAVNIGTGSQTSILELASSLTTLCGSSAKPQIVGSARVGDIRHCFANVTKARKLLNFRATTSLRNGLESLVAWAKTNKWQAIDRVEQAYSELREKQLA